MLKTLKGKIMTVVIIALLGVNFGISILVYDTFYNQLKANIKSDMEGIKNFTTSTLKYGDIVIEDSEKVRSKTIYEVNSNYECYVGLYDNEGNVICDGGNLLKSDSIENILKDSASKGALIRFNNRNGLISTYVYPIYFNGDYDSSLIIQKNYDLYYSNIKKTMANIIGVQSILLAAITIILNYFVNRIIRPLKILIKEMNKYGEGKEPEKIEISSKDEIGQVTDAFNQMIVDKKKLEAASKEFFNNATHELKTPITSIYGYLQILDEEDINNMNVEFKNRAINRMLMECCKLRDLIQKLLEISRCGVRKKEIAVEFDLKQMINEICERLIDRAERLNKKFVIDMTEIRIKAIKDDVEHIILNLIDNALKYSAGNKILIELNGDKDKFFFNISNKITEIPEDVLKNLFDPFVKYNKFDDNLENCITSSGLGLYLCKELADKNNLDFMYTVSSKVITFELKNTIIKQ